MLELTALVVTALSAAGERRRFTSDEEVEVTWRHYPDDPDSVWFLDVDVNSVRWPSAHASLVTA